MQGHILSGMAPPGIPQGRVRDLTQKEPERINLIDIGGVYRFHLVGGDKQVIRVDGGIPVDVHFNKEKNQAIQIRSLITGTLVHEEDGKWVDNPAPSFVGLMFNAVFMWEILVEPPEENDENNVGGNT